MEDKHAQESKVFKIPIEEFEEELNLEGVKEKKKKIHEVFTVKKNMTKLKIIYMKHVEKEMLN